MKEQKIVIIRKALELAAETESESVFLFLNTGRICAWFLGSEFAAGENFVLVIPKALDIDDSGLKSGRRRLIRNWSGNQSRFSRIKYAFLNGVVEGIVHPNSKVVCVLGPWGKNHLDTITIHDLALSWSEEFPFDVRSLITNRAFQHVMAVLDIALDIGALGREGKSVGTTFVVGDETNVLELSHQAVFNPFRGYPRKERYITRPEVVESIKELAQLDGAIIISETGVVEAAGRHLDAGSVVTKELRGLGARHRSAAGITRKTDSVAVVISESTGRVTIFEKGRVVSSLEPVISRRLE